MKTLIKLFAAFLIATASTVTSAETRALIVVTSHDKMGETNKRTGLWLAEMTHPYYELTEAGIKVEIASIKGGAAPIDPNSLADDDAINKEFLANPATRTLLDNTLTLADVDPARYQAIVFAGGHGTVWDFSASQAVNDIGFAVYQQGGFVAAVCHGPAALLNIRDDNGRLIIEGKKVAGFSNKEEQAVGLTNVVPYLLQDELAEGGAEYLEGGMFESFVVQDGRLITGQNPQSALELGKTLVDSLINNS
ncbi:type 1 glutamine amidotransferase domain-containing protein [Marinobacter salinisoli]|uniref:Type 1 glutamine amidotransferase domain-containing protein n=1 Tax=Marinobacter salinisoli TaxID=2769486 RepID=A0ABX7MRU7_9GAMM|nr:type 1 glutamine amidotransferase domain-containing protein [Marinobacter salinisoli]QSP94913.1 type 1 glutamine amidotransferase domain-containing protein [Marinobacter salinisoli]